MTYHPNLPGTFSSPDLDHLVMLVHPVLPLSRPCFRARPCLGKAGSEGPDGSGSWVVGRDHVTNKTSSLFLLPRICTALALQLSFRAVVLEAAAGGGMLTAITATTHRGLSLLQVQLPTPRRA